MLCLKVGQPLDELIQLCYAADQPLLMVGAHGIGKSEIPRQTARRLGIDCIARDLSLMEPPDLVGLPRMEGGRTRYCPPDFLPSEKTKGLLIFEELNRCPLYMRQPCLQLLSDRTLNDYRLPRGWLPIASVNPTGEDYEVAELDPALQSRFTVVLVQADRALWLAWARGHRVHRSVIEYVESDETVFDDPRSNPRAWKHVSDLLQAHREAQLSELTLRVAVAGKVGPERTAAFFRFLRDHVRPCTAEEILTAYAGHQEQVQGWVKSKQLDLVEGTLLSVQKYLQPEYDFAAVRADRSAWRNLGHFLADLPGDLREKARKFFAERNYPFPKKSRRSP